MCNAASYFPGSWWYSELVVMATSICYGSIPHDVAYVRSAVLLVFVFYFFVFEISV